MAVVVAQLAKRSLPTPKNRSSNPTDSKVCFALEDRATAVVAQSVERPELRSLNEMELSDMSSSPGCGIRW